MDYLKSGVRTLHDWVPWLIAGISSGLTAACLHLYELRRGVKDPDRRNRYRALPVRFKAICALICCPMFSGIPVALLLLEQGKYAGVVFCVSLPLYLWLEIACVSWYREKELL